MDSLQGTREAPGRQERTNWTACEAPGRHQGTAREAPGRQERTILDSLKGTREAPGRQERLIGQPGRHQGDTREAGKD